MKHHCKAPPGYGAKDTGTVSPKSELSLPGGELGGQTLNKRMLYAAKTLALPAAPALRTLEFLNF